MADNTTITLSDGDELADCSPKSGGLSTSFIITFEDDDENSLTKLKKNKNSNMFVRRHVRTLSLPAGNDQKPSKDASDLGDLTADAQKRSVTHIDKMKTDSSKSEEKRINGGGTSSMYEDYDNQVAGCFDSTSVESVDDGECSDIELKDGASDNDSEGGTYTLDKNNRQVQLARKSIDQVFGISSSNENTSDASDVDKVRSKERMIDEWMEQSVSALESTNLALRIPPITLNTIPRSKQYISKIPSPVVRRRALYLGAASSVTSSAKSILSSTEKKIHPTLAEIKDLTKLKSSSSNEEIDTESYLKETENIVVALQNRLHEELRPNKAAIGHEKEGNKYANTRFNRAFSLRRDRSKKASSGVGATAIPVRTKIVTALASKTRYSTGSNGFATEGERRSSLPKDIKTKKISQPTPICYPSTRNEHSSKKQSYQRLKTSNGGMRSSSSLSAQEIEFQNWKRRKNYDPLKAAAEDRKKKTMQSSISCGPSQAALLTEKEKSTSKKTESEFRDQGIMRSASFHGLRNKTKFGRCAFSEDNNTMRSSRNSRFLSSACLSNENSISSDVLEYDDDNDWVIPKPPSTSLQNTPPESVCSRLSLLSNAASCSSAFRTSSPLSKVNLATLTNVTQLSQVIRISVSSLSNCLRSNNNNNKVEHFKVKENGLTAKIETIADVDGKLVDNEYASCKNGVHHEVNSSNLIDEENDFDELSVDHQLRVTLDNLRQIHIAVQELQLVCLKK